MKYRMIGLDMDGTLLQTAGGISPENVAAISRAQDAGVLVVPCTGRSWRESIRQLVGYPNPGMGIFATGAMIADIQSGKSVDLAMIEPHVAMQIIEKLRDLPESVLILTDRHITGYDYLVTGSGTLTANTQWWFGQTQISIHFKTDVTHDDLHHALRVGMVANGVRAKAASLEIEKRLGDQINMHCFEAVHQPDPSECVFILEIFGASVDKWRGLVWLAQQQGIKPNEIVMMGDQINDVSAISQAGCGIAMDNAIDAVKEVANHHTLHCDQHGVAYAIDQLLSGGWQ
ncbi:HAD-IIB family hydrolase [bacterium AH-315-I18]|nr:HAD-IIB family hydrolase [bacterium AH-315-I18]